MKAVAFYEAVEMVELDNMPGDFMKLTCPLCAATGFPSFAQQTPWSLMYHVIDEHMNGDSRTDSFRETCWCGKKFDSTTALGMHLGEVGIDNIEAHCLDNAHKWLTKALGESHV